MTRSCGRDGIVIVVIFAIKALVHESFETATAVFFGITIQVIIAHLVNNDADDELGLIWRGSDDSFRFLRKSRERHEQKA